MRRGGFKLGWALMACMGLTASGSAHAQDPQQQKQQTQEQTTIETTTQVGEQTKTVQTTTSISTISMWNPEWPKFRPVEYAVTGVAGAAAIAAYLFLTPPSQPHWRGGILFDDAARDSIRLETEGARDTARGLSDITVASAGLILLGIDSILIPLLKKDRTTAMQLTLMNLEAMAFSSLTTTTLFTAVGRARPLWEDCQRDPNHDRLCNSSPTASFPSGHANGAFTAAGLSCAHHAYLPLYGGGVGDVLACIGQVALAASTGTLRVMGDRHYVTDVLASGIIGFGFGFSVPTLLHYVAGPRNGSPPKMSLVPMGGDSRYGLVAVGSF